MASGSGGTQNVSPSTQHYLRTIARQEQQIKRLVSERDEALETVRQLREKEQREIAAYPVPRCFNLTNKETAMLSALLKYRVLTKEQFLSLLYDDEDRWPDIKIIDVFICKIRAKINAYDVEIETVWGQGYRMDRRMKLRVQELVEEETHGRPMGVMDGAERSEGSARQ